MITFKSSSELAAALRRAAEAHHAHETKHGKDENWPAWYAAFLFGSIPPYPRYLAIQATDHTWRITDTQLKRHAPFGTRHEYLTKEAARKLNNGSDPTIYAWNEGE